MPVGEGDARWWWSRNFGEAEGVEHAAGLRRSVTVRSPVGLRQLGPRGLRSGEWGEEGEAGRGCEGFVSWKVVPGECMNVA